MVVGVLHLFKDKSLISLGMNNDIKEFLTGEKNLHDEGKNFLLNEDVRRVLEISYLLFIHFCGCVIFF